MVQFIDALLGLFAGPALAVRAGAKPSRGQGLVEYALILAFISIVLFLGVVLFGARLTAIYSRLGSSVPGSE
jgi:Flp pilus assembly pilin Flp